MLSCDAALLVSLSPAALLLSPSPASLPQTSKLTELAPKLSAAAACLQEARSYVDMSPEWREQFCNNVLRDLQPGGAFNGGAAASEGTTNGSSAAPSVPQAVAPAVPAAPAAARARAAAAAAPPPAQPLPAAPVAEPADIAAATQQLSDEWGLSLEEQQAQPFHPPHAAALLRPVPIIFDLETNGKRFGSVEWPAATAVARSARCIRALLFSTPPGRASRSHTGSEAGPCATSVTSTRPGCGHGCPARRPGAPYEGWPPLHRGDCRATRSDGGDHPQQVGVVEGVTRVKHAQQLAQLAARVLTGLALHARPPSGPSPHATRVRPCAAPCGCRQMR